MNKSTKSTRAKLAGISLANSIIEMVNLMYQNKTALNFLNNVVDVLAEEADERNERNERLTYYSGAIPPKPSVDGPIKKRG